MTVYWSCYTSYLSLVNIVMTFFCSLKAWQFLDNLAAFLVLNKPLFIQLANRHNEVFFKTFRDFLL